MVPASLSVRLTNRLVAGHDTYHFRSVARGPNNERRITSTLVDDLLDTELNLPGGEFFLGGQITRDVPADKKQALRDKGVTVDADPARLLAGVADKFLGAGA